jgi:hypothetical protein
MEKTFFVLVVLLVSISIWEYFSGKILDIGFTKILMLREKSPGKFLRIISAQLVVWIFLLMLMFVAYAIIFQAGSIDLRRVRTYIILIFILIIFPFAMVRKRFATWVKKNVSNKKK